MLMVLVALAFAAAGHAQTVHQVTNLNDSGAGSLRQAINVCGPTDSISFTVTGTITLASELVIASQVTINGPAGSPGITLDCANGRRAFHMQTTSQTGTVHIENIRILNGRAVSGSSSGGGIRLATTLGLNLDGVIFENCYAPADGGGLQITTAASVALTDCTFTGNDANAGYGGGISTFTTSFTLTNCTFDGNTANGAGNGGGGVNAGSAAVTITGCTFTNNTAPRGGGLYSAYNPNTNPNTLVTDCTFTGNNSPLGGGVLILWGSNTYDFVGCTFDANQSNAGGGVAIHADNTIQVNFTNCTFSENTIGAGLYVGGPGTATNVTAELTNCTMYGDTSAGAGNSIFVGASDPAGVATLILRNTIVSTNTPCIGTTGSGTNTITSDDNNICSDTTGNLTQANDQPNTNANLAALANNGGPTKTHKPQAGSPAIDQGRAITGVTTDQRGVTRPIDDSAISDAANGNGSDVGAVEVEAAPQISVGTSNWVNAGGGLYTLTLDPGDPIADILIAADPGSAAMTVTVTPPTTTFAGLTMEPVTNSTPVSGPIDLEWAGTAGAGNPPGSYDWVILVSNGSASTNLTARIILQDLAPSHAIQNATGGNGSNGNPYTIAFTVGVGGTGATNLATVSDPNTSQTPLVTGVTPATSHFTFSITAGSLRVLPTGTAAAGSQQYDVQVSDGGANTINIYVAITVNSAPAFTTPSPLPNAQEGQPYTQSVAASGGTGALTFAALSTLPGSLVLSAGGSFSGLPGAAGGPFNFTLQATDSWGMFASQVFSLTVDPPASGTPSITTTSPLPPAETGQAYQVTLQATGGAGGYTFTLTGGALPAGLSLNAAGDISGSATSAGNFSFTVTVTDSALASSAKLFTLDVTNPGSGGGGGGGGDGGGGGCRADTQQSCLLLLAILIGFAAVTFRRRA
ncbi:MAG: right-handed parallel beta-helix repeat-containing protein [Planctomycetes bacterium]|nr:right-handed parallel beta-helix repeat-containing protein [Planctomycetota bacterium]